nr:WRKY family transcription factor [Tanacetum cinerariifolium]
MEMIVDVDSTAHGVWKRLKDLFHDNKDARITQLDNKIRNMSIGNASITDFFQQIKSKADHLANLESPVKDSSLVTYVINGIRSKYSEAARVIRLSEKAHTFDELRSMMFLKESDMSHSSSGNSLLHNTSSSHTVLVASTSNIDKANTMSTSGLDVCRNFQCGSCTYGARCKFVHGANDFRSRPNPTVTTRTGDLYPVTQQPSSTTTFALLSLSPTMRHRRLGHPSEDVLRRLKSSRFISYNKIKFSALYHACQLGKHTRLPFYSSESNVGSVFDIIHSDL